MWNVGWRESIWSALDRQWDLVIVGGGITGAGVLAEAARMGLSVLLVEAGDFASGTSSRSTKLVHGGLRYLRNAQIGLTRASVRERERLLKEGGGLVQPLRFFVASFAGDKMPKWMFGAGLAIYDLLARKWAHGSHDAAEIIERVPSLRGAGLQGGYHYFDAQTDDARLVLRVLREAVRRGGVALSYARASSLLRDAQGQVQGVVLTDAVTGKTAEVKARAVMNATGAWADGLRGHVGQKKKLRIIRGSHLCFDRARLPLESAVTMLHPRDGRAVFAVPWEGVTLVGSTDIDHPAELASEPHISAEETEYLMGLARHAFPSRDLTRADVVSTYAGVRGVIDTGASDPSKESREHALWMEDGLLTVTGGKLTTFRVMAREALHALRGRLGKEPETDRILDDTRDVELPTSAQVAARLLGRHGVEAADILAAPEKDEPIDGTPALWSELRYAARSEGVVRLEDLLLRRVRLGILMPQGGASVMDRVRAVAQPELGWDDATWAREEAAYLATWKKSYAVID